MAKKIDDLLADSLVEISRKKSLDSITVTELVTAAGVNRKTFYNHFDGIEGLLRYIIREKQSQTSVDRSSLEKWDEHIRRAMHCMKTNAAFTAKIFQSRYLRDLQVWLRPEMDQSLRDFIRLELELLQKNTGKSYPINETQMQQLVDLYAPCVYALIEEWYAQGMSQSIDEFINLVVRILAGGVVACVMYLLDEPME